MKALASFGKSDVRVIDKPKPRLEHPEDAVVRVTTAAICGSDQQAIMLADIFPTGYMAADLAGIRPGDTVAVFGCGPVGLFAQKSARDFFHAGRVIAIDQIAGRLRFAAEHCGAAPVNFRDTPDIVQHLKDMPGGRGPDACIDAVGLEAEGDPIQAAAGSLFLEAGSTVVLTWAINAVRHGGTISILGVYGPPFNHFFPIGWAMNRGLTFRMGQCNVLTYLSDLPGKTRRGEIDPAFVVSHELPLAEAPRGYSMFERRQDGAIKVLLKP